MWTIGIKTYGNGYWEYCAVSPCGKESVLARSLPDLVEAVKAVEERKAK